MASLPKVIDMTVRMHNCRHHWIGGPDHRRCAKCGDVRYLTSAERLELACQADCDPGDCNDGCRHEWALWCPHCSNVTYPSADQIAAMMEPGTTEAKLPDAPTVASAWLAVPADIKAERRAAARKVVINMAHEPVADVLAAIERAYGLVG